jgi:hypothetical protein
MKRIQIFFVGLISFIILFGCGQQKEEVIEDIVAAYPYKTQVLYENDYVKVVEFNLNPGDKLPMHKGGSRVIYSLSDYTLKWNEGGKVTEKSWEKGEIHWHDALDHAAENIGETNANYMTMTRTDLKLPDAGDYTVEEDAGKKDQENSSVVFENDNVRVIEVNLPAGAAQEMHDGINRLIYSLNDYSINYASDKAEPKEMEMKSGEFHWHGADQHAVENIGETAANYLIFEFKK